MCHDHAAAPYRRFAFALFLTAGAVIVGGCTSAPTLTAEECQKQTQDMLSRIPVNATKEQLAKFEKELEELNKKQEKSDCAGTIARSGNPSGGF